MLRKAEPSRGAVVSAAHTSDWTMTSEKVTALN